MYEIKEIINPNEWENFVLNQPYTFFVQSSAYGDFYQSLDEKSWIFGIYNNDKLVGGSLVVSTHAKRGNFLYLPYGPILNFEEPELLKKFIDFIANFAKSNNYIFIRVSPFTEDNKIMNKTFIDCGFRRAPMHVLAETSWVLNILPTEDELLANMEKTHRYLIRRCQKEGVKIELSTDIQLLEKFNLMHDTTAERHNFHRFSRQHIDNEFKIFCERGQAVILSAYLPDGTLDAMSIIMYFGNMGVYRHSASLGLNKKLPTSYLLQWEAIREAKKRGMKWYNFWGIAPTNASKKHPFFGITHFKKGFGGQQLDILHCHDFIISKFYWFNWIIETVRRIKRRF